MNILYYLGNFPKLSESFVLNEIAELKENGHEVAVFALRDPDEEITHEEYDELEIPTYYAEPSYRDITRLYSPKLLSAKSLRTLTPSLPFFSPLVVGKNLLLGIQCVEFAVSLDFNIDIVHGHFCDSDKIGEVFTARYLGVPCTVTAHAQEIFKSPNLKQIRFLCESVDHVFVPSEYNQTYLRDMIGVENEVTVVPATTKITKFGPADEPVPNRILTVARLVEKKGHEYGIDAVARLVEQGYDLEYHIIGTGEREALLRQRVAKWGIEDAVTFSGHISDEQLRKEFGAASVFMLPCVVASDGDRDAMPVVLKESMASEIACVSTTVSAIPELITDGEDGLLVSPEDTDELMQAIQSLLDDRDLRRSIARNGRKTVTKRFDIAKSVNKIVDLFEEEVRFKQRA